MYHRYFDQELIDLQQEITHHPDLLHILSIQEDKDIYISIAEISAFCGVVLDGDYTKDDILGICKTCTRMLYERRTGIVIPTLQ
jgi:hypothetical protein